MIELFTCVIKCRVVSFPPNRQEALLAAISEKDANIALLELSSSKKKKTQDEVAMLKREKDRLVQQLKQQVGLLITVEGNTWLRCWCYFHLTVLHVSHTEYAQGLSGLTKKKVGKIEHRMSVWLSQ